MINYLNLSNEDLLKIVVMEKKGEDISTTLLKEFSSLPSIIVNSDEDELLKVKGIGIKRVQQIKAINELTRRLYLANIPKKISIKSPSDVSKLVIPDLSHETKEHFKILLLNVKNEVLSYETISIGSLSSSLVHPRELFIKAIKKSAAGIILIHNHPSGNPRPSEEDLSITKRLVEVGKIIGIDVLDHIIIGGNNFISLREKSLM